MYPNTLITLVLVGMIVYIRFARMRTRVLAGHTDKTKCLDIQKMGTFEKVPSDSSQAVLNRPR